MARSSLEKILVQLPRMFHSSSSAANKLSDVVIVGAARTPMGSFRGCLSAISAPQLGAVAIEAAIQRAGIPKDSVTEVFMGNVLQAGVGQAPARQATLYAGLPKSTICTTVNKLCASGMKAIMLAAQSLVTGDQDIVVAGGMESMSNVPYYLKRGETKYGGMMLEDGIVVDGLTDAYNKTKGKNHMGNCAEHLAETYKISKEEQDTYAVGSYTRSESAYINGDISAELTPVHIPQKRGKPAVVVEQDEEFKRINLDKFTSLPSVFQDNGTITAGNASTINDGGAACVLMTEAVASKMNVKPQARILGIQDAATDPINFGIAPALAVPKLLKKCSLTEDDIDLWEINEAFSVVALACIQELKLDPSKVNVHGGAVSLGHPIGMSGARIVVHLIHALKPGQKGVAAICNGGGGASSVLIEKL